MQTETNQPKIIIQADGKDYRLNTEAVSFFIQDINKFTCHDEIESLLEVLAVFAEDGVPSNYSINEYKIVMRLLRKTSILLQDFVEEVN